MITCTPNECFVGWDCFSRFYAFSKNGFAMTLKDKMLFVFYFLIRHFCNQLYPR